MNFELLPILTSLCLYSLNLGSFWLKIEQFWPFEEIYIFSNGGHLGYRTAQPTISLEMPVPSQGHYGFHSFPVVD
jgi:hypothetical protein